MAEPTIISLERPRADYISCVVAKEARRAFSCGPAASARYAGHAPAACTHPRTSDGSGCVCDLRRWGRKYSDWPIARLVGAATYAQLVDSAPGLFEVFPDLRSDGGASSIATLTSADHALEQRGFCGGLLSREKEAPPPPSAVSALLAGGELTPADLKRMLICAAVCAEQTRTIYPKSQGLIDSRGANAPGMHRAAPQRHVSLKPSTLVDGECDCSSSAAICEDVCVTQQSCVTAVSDLIGSSVSYKYPEMLIFDIVVMFVALAAVVGAVATVIVASQRE
jgi:hypothetical protein